MEEKTKNKPLLKKILKSFLAILFIIGVFKVTEAAHAASLYFSPSSGTYTVGQTFSVSVFVSSPDQPMNAASGALSVSADTLAITGVSKGGTVSFWPREPSSSGDTIRFEGVVVNPGYTGTGGKMVVFSLKAIAAGTGTVRFSSGSILANDGNGTNITSGLGSATFTIKEAAPPKEEPAKEEPPKKEPPKEEPLKEAAPALPPVPPIYSSTHPDPNAWYLSPNLEFWWSLPPGVKAVSFLTDSYATTEPDTQPETFGTAAALENLVSGTGYFHIRFENEKGWGPSAHFKFQVDTLPPDPFVIHFPLGTETYCPRPDVFFSATDQHSGISFYTLSVDNEQAITLQPEAVSELTPYFLFSRPVGTHTVTVTAVDRAGNKTTVSAAYTIKEPQKEPAAPLPSMLTCPDYTLVFSLLIGAIFLLFAGLLGLGYWVMNLRKKMAVHLQNDLMAPEAGVSAPPEESDKPQNPPPPV